MSNPYIIIAAALAPIVLLFLYIYFEDKNQREPIPQLLKGLLFGALSAPIAVLLEEGLLAIGVTATTEETTSVWQATINAFAGAALPEECSKFLMLWLLLRRNKYFDERFDGIVYAACVGLGFAGTENLLYLFANIDGWQTVAISRAMIAVPAHFFFAVAMGYYFSIYYFDHKPFYMVLLLLIPIILHGIYDGLLMVSISVPALAPILTMLFYVFCWKLYKYAKRRMRRHLIQDQIELQVNKHSSPDLDNLD